MGNKPQEFVFVNGPTLASGSNAHSRKIKSALIKRGISEKQTNYRREEAARRERLIDQRKGQGDHQHAFKQLCLCRRKSQGSGSDQTQTIHSSPTFLVTSDGATAWIQQSSQNKLLIYSTLWSASYHRDVLRISYGAPDPALETKEQLYYKGLVLNTLHSHVADYTDETWRDSVIMSVLYLAVNDLVKGKVARDATPFTPPFVNLQSLSFYGSREYHDMHWTFIQTLLKRLGGIHSIRLFGLGWLLSILPNEHDSPDCVIEQPNGPGDDSLSLELYHACRLSALLYALHVTFPVPKSSAPRAMIVPQLTEKLHHVSQNMSSTLLLWCATVAAIAAEGMIQRQTLVQLTDKVRLDLQIYQLAHAVEVLHSFAWVDVACLDGLCRLWDEIVRLG
ncbi:hypothetical protein APSETT444_006871 [Aspergillus pseudonomiae]